MPAMKNVSNVTAPTQFIEVKNERYAYRSFGRGPGLPLLFLQHFRGTLDNWDPAVTDPLATGREVILFESAGLGRSSGNVAKTGSWNGTACPGVPERAGSEYLRRPWVLARRDGRSADGA